MSWKSCRAIQKFGLVSFQHFRGTSYSISLTGPLFRKQEQEEAVCPITLGFIKDINDYTFLVCVGKDHQFRAWDLQVGL